MNVLILRRNIGDTWTTINDWFCYGFERAGHAVTALNIPHWGSHRFNDYPSLTRTNLYRIRKLLSRQTFDLAFILHGGGYWSTEMLRELKQASVATVYYNPDDPMLFNAVSCHIAPYVDHVLTFPKVVDRYKDELGIDAIPFFYCVDPDVEYGEAPTTREKNDYASDIVLTGNIDVCRKKKRGDYLIALHEASVGSVALYGPPPRHPSEKIQAIYKGTIDDNKMNNSVMRSSKIVFHYTQELQDEEWHLSIPDRYQSVSGRIFDGAAAGRLVMTNYFADLEKAFEIGKELVTYEGIDDAIEKARYYLRHGDERKKIAAAGKKRALHGHTVMDRIKQIEAILAQTVIGGCQNKE